MIAEPTAARYHTQGRDRGLRPGGASPAETQNAARWLQQKTEVLAKDADGVCSSLLNGINFGSIHMSVASWSRQLYTGVVDCFNQEVTLFISTYQGGSHSAYPTTAERVSLSGQFI